MKKLICIILSLLCAFTTVAFVGCNPENNNESGKEYNIIFTLATIPPVLAALDCINNGNETYAFIERGKTYNGIDNVTGFSNIGFDKANNTSTGFTNADFDTVVDKIKDLNVNGNEKFNIYVCDYTVLMGFGLVASAELKNNQYQIVLCEIGGETYKGLDSDYITGKTVDSSTDEPYEKFLEDITSVKSKIATILSKKKHKVNFDIGYDLAYPAATLSNVKYLIQDEVNIKNRLEMLGSENCKTKLLPVFGFEGNTDIRINFDFGSISERVERLQPAQKKNYLKLMYGEYFEDTYSTLTRSTLSDNVTEVPSEKLVFIGSRANSYPHLAKYFGYVDVTDASQVPDSYDELKSMYKTDFLFGKEEDYQLFINELKDATNYENNALPEQEFLDAIKVDCFNYYIDYLVTLKFTYLKYGKDYDIVLKGHPSEVLGEHETWNQHYDVSVNEQDYRYDKLYDNLLSAFHEQDSIGKYIGLIPFGTAAENLAYLGVDISLCGLSSGTYTGYEQSVDIKFVIATVDTAIDSDTNISGRYANGTLLDHDKNGKEDITAFFNIGNLYKQLIEYYSSEEHGNNIYKAYYEDKFKAWLRAVNGLAEDADTNGYDVDNQGFLITPND
ncbi:MAG: hypothetical protein J1G05_03200 [Clostridiales bacterium]|nr:hypothetical protein [Clostridiales bacterium]